MSGQLRRWSELPLPSKLEAAELVCGSRVRQAERHLIL